MMSLLTLASPAWSQEAPPEPTRPLGPVVDEEAPSQDTFVPPELVSDLLIPWPQDAAVDQAVVGLTLEIGADGKVVHVEIIAPAGPPFDALARDALASATFRPAQDASGPIAVLVDFTYEFVRPPPPPPPTGRLEGEVLEKGTAVPLAGARVVVQTHRGALETTTDAHGRWRLDEVPSGTMSLKVVHASHDDATATINVNAHELASVRLYARSRAYGENEAVGRYEIVDAPIVTRRSISMDETRRIPGSFGDPVRAVTNLPGVALSTGRGPGGQGLVLRGSNPTNSKVYVDGVEIPLVFHLGNFRSVVNPNLIDRVDYLPGTFGVSYGRGTGGVIDIRTSNEYPQKWRAAWQTDLLDTSVFLQGRIGAESSNPMGITATFRRSYLDLWLPSVIPDELPTINPRWFDWQVKIDDLAGAGRWSLFAFGSDDRMFITSNEEGPGDQSANYGTTRLLARWRSDSDREVRGFVQPFVGADGVAVGLGESGSLEIDAFTFGLRAEVVGDVSPALAIAAGVDASASRELTSASFPDLPRPNSDPFAPPEPVESETIAWTWSPDPYAELRLRPLEDRDRWLVSTGLRASTWGVDDEGAIAAADPRILTRFRMTEAIALKAGTGLYHQTLAEPSMNPYEVLDLPFERAWSSELGVEATLSGSWSIDGTAFYKDVDQIAVDNADVHDPESDPLYVDTGVGRMYGLELMIRKQEIGPLFGWVSYTLSRSERRDASGSEWFAFDFDQTHNLVALAGYRFPYDLELSGRTQYVTGRPFTENAEGYFDIDTATYEPVSGPTNAARQPPYSTVDVRASKLWTFQRVQVSTYADVLGILRGENPQGVSYSYDFSEYTFVAGLPTIPSIGFEIKGAL